LPKENKTDINYLESVYKLPDLEKDVFPAKAGIQSFQDLLDAGSGPA
jgi:hypothetical protein